jgi:hypothetical protein
VVEPGTWKVEGGSFAKDLVADLVAREKWAACFAPGRLYAVYDGDEFLFTIDKRGVEPEPIDMAGFNWRDGAEGGHRHQVGMAGKYGALVHCFLGVGTWSLVHAHEEQCPLEHGTCTSLDDGMCKAGEAMDRREAKTPEGIAKAAELAKLTPVALSKHQFNEVHFLQRKDKVLPVPYWGWRSYIVPAKKGKGWEFCICQTERYVVGHDRMGFPVFDSGSVCRYRGMQPTKEEAAQAAARGEAVLTAIQFLGRLKPDFSKSERSWMAAGKPNKKKKNRRKR